MSNDLDRQGRLNFLSIDSSTRSALSDLRLTALSEIDDILADVARQWQQVPQLAGRSLDSLRGHLRSFWSDFVFQGNFGDDYQRHAQALADAAAAAGIEFRWVAAAHALTLNRLIAVAVPHFGKKTDKLQAALTALTKAVVLDLDITATLLSHSNAGSKSGSRDDLARTFEKDVSTVVDVVAHATRQLQTSAQTLASGADQTARQAEAVAQAAQQASGNVDTVAAATEELHASIKEISRQVEQSAAIATEAVGEAGRADGIVQGLAQAAQRIGEVVKLINDIASQTNLLALNATIEAARAGDAGKGFAVVAGEVKNLANQTARATDDISAQVQGVQEATKQAVSAIQSIGSTIGRMSEIASIIAAAVEEQGSATRDIARNVQEAARGTQDVSSHISGVTQATETAGRTARDVLHGVGDLNQQTEQLAQRVANFLTAMRGA